MKAVKKKDLSRLTDHIGYWMRMVSNHVSYSFAKKLEVTEVTVAEWVVLREMYGSDDIASPSRVADLTGLTRGAVSKLITRLLAKGLVTRRESVDDRRYQDIELTEKAVGLLPKLATLADKNDEDFFSVLSRKEREQLVELLKKIAVEHELNGAPID